MTTISSAQVRMYAQSAGFPSNVLDLMTAIAMAESSNQTDVVNSIGAVGLWQINQPVHVSSHPAWTIAYLKDPLHNAIAAKSIYDSQGLQAWEAYTNGAYKKYLGTTPTQASSGSLGLDPGGQLPNQNWTDGLGNDLTAPFTAAASFADALQKSYDWIKNPHNLVRIAQVTVGGALVIGALIMISKPITEPIAKTAAKYGKLAAV